MSFSKKSDVKNHLSTHRPRTLLRFKLPSSPNGLSSGAELSESDRSPSVTTPITRINAFAGSGTDAAAITKPQA